MSTVAKFLLVGTIGFCIDAVGIVVLSHAGLSPISARPISFLLAVTATWLLNREFTFAMPRNTSLSAEWLRYVASGSSGMLLNLSVYYSLVVAFGAWLHPVLAIAVGSVSAMCLNYLGAKHFVFRPAESTGKQGSSQK